MSFKDQFPDWEDFPRGLRVLVVDTQDEAATSVGKLLEDCAFHATACSSGDKAFSLLEGGQQKFHVALVEATMTQEGAGAFDLKKASNHLPVILMSGSENLMLMTQSVTMGAVDFVQKPLSVDKIKDRNIWMHVLRKAHQDGVKLVKPGREACTLTESVGPLVKVKDEPQGAEDVATSSGDNHSASPINAATEPQEGTLERTSSNKGLTSTPPSQKVKGEQAASPISSSPQNSDVTNVAAPKSEAEDADTQRSPGGMAEFSFREGGDGFEGFGIYDQNGLIDVKLELDGADCLGGAVVDADGHTEADLCLADSFLPLEALGLTLDPMGGETHNREMEEEDARMLAEMACIAEDSPDSCAGPGPYSEHSGEGSLMRHDSLISFDGSGQSDGDTGQESDGNGGKSERSSKRTKKMDWSPDMHRRFVEAVEKIGIDKAIPSKILDHMGCTNLTRHNVASHLQKYRTHRKHMLQSKEGEATNWSRRSADSAPYARPRRDGSAWGSVSSHPPPIQPRPAQMPLHSLHSGPHMGAPLHVWGHPTIDHSGAHMWQHPHMGHMPSAPWMGADGMTWQHPSETWGHPTAPPLAGGWPHGPPLLMKGGMHHPPGSPWVHPPPLMIKMGGPGQGIVTGDRAAYLEEGLSVPMYPLHPMQHTNVAAAASAAAMQGPPELNPPKEILDAAISEALANPYSCLPLGLNPPSMEGVLAELQKNGDGMDIIW